MADFVFDLETSPDAAAPPATDGVFSHNTAHVQEGINHLIDLFRDGPRNQATLEATLEQVQELEDAIWSVYEGFDPATAEGHALNLLGALVGEPRLGRDDDDYRAGIRVRVLINYSNGKPEELYAILVGMFPEGLSPFPNISITESFPAHIDVQVLASSTGGVSITTLAKAMRQAKAGGVSLSVTFGFDTGTTNTMLWHEGSTAVDDYAHGWNGGTGYSTGWAASF